MKTSASIEIGQRVARERKRLGLKQIEFAERIGFSRSYLGGVESGKTHASGAFLRAVCNAFDISIDGLLNPSMPQKKEAHAALKENIQGLLRAIDADCDDAYLYREAIRVGARALMVFIDDMETGA